MNPETIGRYEIISEIGRGGMATIYEAYDPVIGRSVAIKVLPAELMNEPQFQVRFQREAHLIASLEHPAIVPIYDFGEHNGRPYFVMRLMKGGSLADRIANGPVKIEYAAKIVSRLAPALDHAHSRGIIHRDLKPGNILFDLDENPYLSDFGIAKLSESSSTLTGSGIIGTPAYMSPEQTHGELNIDGRSDLYSLGIIIFELLSGRLPYLSDEPMGQIVMHTSTPIPFIQDINPNLPPEVQNFINQALAKRKFARFDKAVDMANALNDLADRNKNSNFKGTSSASSPNGAIFQDLGEKTFRTTPKTPQPPYQTPKPNPQMPIRTPPPPPSSDLKASNPAEPDQKKTPSRFWLVGILLLLVSAGIGVYVLFPDIFTDILSSRPAATLAKEAVTPRATTQTPETIIAPTNTSSSPTLPEASSATPERVVSIATETPTEVPPTATSSPSPTPSGPIIGGSDKIAFLRNNEVYIANLDATEIRQLTLTHSIKSDLQWAPDGEHILFISEPCVQQVSIYDEKVSQATSILCANWAQYLAAFEISPDYNWVALSLSDGLFIYRYDPNVLRQISRQPQLESTEHCLALTNIRPRSVRWSKQSDQVAVVVTSSSDGRQQEVIWVLDVAVCGLKDIRPVIEFPGAHFSMEGYDISPHIASFGWNGDYVFALNVDRKSTGFGFFYRFNIVTFKDEIMYPLVKKCCFRDFLWSPDSTYLLFAFQDFDIQKETKLYYINYLTLGNNVPYEPMPFPDGFFSNPKEKPMPVLRPAR